MPALSDDSSDPLTVAYAVETISAVIARRADDPRLLIENRQLFVDGADRSGGAGRRRASLFSADFIVASDRRDRLYASRLVAALRNAGFSVLSRDRIARDDEEADAAQHLILLVGQQTSPYLQSEYRKFVLDLISEESSRILIPVVYAPQGAQALPASLRNFHWIDAWERPESDVVGEISERVGRRASTTWISRPAGETLDAWFSGSESAFQQLLVASPYAELYKHGVWKVGYVFEPEPRLELTELREALIRSAGSETGWPAWMWADFGDRRPHVVGGVIECWLASPESTFAGGSHADYWRASPRGRMFLLRGYEDDDEPTKRMPGTAFDLTLPIWRTAEAITHACRMAGNIGLPEARVELRAEWTGLSGRRLSSWAQPARDVFAHRVAIQDSVQRDIATAAAEIEENLEQLVYELLKGVYVIFDFFELPFGLVEEEVQRFRKSVVR
jgi:hypothetical protein